MVVIWKSRVAIAKIPKVGNIKTIKIGDVRFPAVPVSKIRPGDYAYDVRDIMQAPKAVKITRVEPVPMIPMRPAQHIRIVAGVGSLATLPKKAYIAVPPATYRKIMPVSVRVPKPQAPRYVTPRGMASASMNSVKNAASASLRVAKVRVPKPRVPDLEF